MRLGEGGQQVLAAHFGRVQAGLGGEQVHRPLHRRGGLRPARAAVGADRRGVRHHRRRHRLGAGDGVGPGRHQDRQGRQERAEPRVGPRVLQDLQPVGRYLPVPAAADGDRLTLRPPVGHAEQVLVAGLGPARGPPEPPGHPADHRVLRVGAELGPERAAHVRGDDPEPGLIDAEHARQGRARPLSALVRDPRRQPAVRAPGRGGGPGLHRGGRDPLVDDGAGDDDLAAVEQVGRQAGGVAEGGGDVAARSREEYGLAGRRLGHVDHWRQHVIVDVNQVRGILALVAALGDDHGQRLADVPDHVRGEQPLAHLGVDQASHRRRHHREIGQVSTGERGDDAGRLERGADVDRADPRVRDRRPDEMYMAGTRQAHVVGVDPAGRQEAGILAPDDPGTQNAHSHDLACLEGGWSKPVIRPARPGDGEPREGRSGTLSALAMAE